MFNISKDEFKRFNRSALTLAIPIMFQNLLNSGVTFIDTLMIGQLGEASIAAVGVASQLFFLIILFLFGVTSASAIFIAQYWGAKDIKGIKRVMGIAMALSVSVSLIVSIVSTLNPTIVMEIFSKDVDVVREGNSYLQVVGFTYVTTAIAFLLSVGFRSTGDAKTPLFISIFALSFNVLGNYLLIFGIGIFPELGVKGAAISTAISRVIEVLLYIIIAQTRKDCPLKFSIKEYFDFDKKFVKEYFKTCSPVIMNEIFWSIGMVFYKIAYSKIGTDALAAVQVIESINNLFFVASSGLANATAVIIGVKIGENDEVEAKVYAKLSIFLSAAIGLFLLGCIIAFAPLFVQFFNISVSVEKLVIDSLFILAFLAPIKSINMNCIVGVLRSGGDTKFSMFLEIGSVWLVGVPMAFLGATVFFVSLPIIYIMVGCEEITKCVIGFSRMHSGKWYHNLTNK